MNKEDIRNKITINNKKLSDFLTKDTVTFKNSKGIKLSKIFPDNDTYKETSNLNEIIKNLDKKIKETFFYINEKDKEEILEELLNETKNDNEEANEYILENAHQLAFVLCYFSEITEPFKFNDKEITLENFFVWTYEKSKEQNQKYTKYCLNYDFYPNYINFISHDAILHRKYSEIKNLLIFENDKSFKFRENEILLEPYFNENNEFICPYCIKHDKGDLTVKYSLLNFLFKLYENDKSRDFSKINFNTYFGFNINEKVYPNDYAYIKKEKDNEDIEKIIINEQIPEWLAEWINNDKNKIDFLSSCGLNTEKSNLYNIRKHLLTGNNEIDDTQVIISNILAKDKQLLKNTLFWLSEKSNQIKNSIIPTLERIYKLLEDIDYPVITISDFENGKYVYSLKLLTQETEVYINIDNIDTLIRQKVIKNSSKPIIYKIHNNKFKDFEIIIYLTPNPKSIIINKIQPPYIIQYNREQINEDKKIFICKQQISLNKIFKDNSENKIVSENYILTNIGNNSKGIYIYISINSNIENELKRLHNIFVELERLKTLKKIFALKEYLKDATKKEIFSICKKEFDANTEYDLSYFGLDNEKDFFLFEEEDNIIGCEYKNTDKRLNLISEIYDNITDENKNIILFISEYDITKKQITKYLLKKNDIKNQIFNGFHLENQNYSNLRYLIWEKSTDKNILFTSKYTETNKAISIESKFIENKFDSTSVKIIRTENITISNNKTFTIHYIKGSIPRIKEFNGIKLEQYTKGDYYKFLEKTEFYANIEIENQIFKFLYDDGQIDWNEYMNLVKKLDDSIVETYKKELNLTDEEFRKYLMDKKLEDEKKRKEEEERLQKIEEIKEINRKRREKQRENITLKNDIIKEYTKKITTNNFSKSKPNYSRSNNYKQNNINALFEIGAEGEIKVYADLISLFGEERVDWVNQDKYTGSGKESGKQWDFEIKEDNNSSEIKYYIDAKATKTKERDADTIAFYISSKEWKFLKGELPENIFKNIQNKYYIARVFDVESENNYEIRYLKLEYVENFN